MRPKDFALKLWRSFLQTHMHTFDNQLLFYIGDKEPSSALLLVVFDMLDLPLTQVTASTLSHVCGRIKAGLVSLGVFWESFTRCFVLQFVFIEPLCSFGVKLASCSQLSLLLPICGRDQLIHHKSFPDCLPCRTKWPHARLLG
jgi:hypothetical protein